MPVEPYQLTGLHQAPCPTAPAGSLHTGGSHMGAVPQINDSKVP